MTTTTATITATTVLFYTGDNFDEFLLELHTAGGMTATECWNNTLTDANGDDAKAKELTCAALIGWMEHSTLSDWNIYINEKEADENAKYGEYTEFTVEESVDALIDAAK